MTARYIDTRMVPLGELTPFPGNARRGNAALIAESVERNGQYRSLVVRRTDDGGLVVLAGNHTLQGLAQLGRTHARCEIIECDDATATRINLVDNKAADDGTYDDEALAVLLASLDDDLVGSGYTETEVYRLTNTDLPEGFPAFDEAIAVSLPSPTPAAPGPQPPPVSGETSGTVPEQTRTCPNCGHKF